MATSNQEQKSVNVRQHKRLAMGEKLNGQTMKSNSNTNPISKKSGGLSSAKKSNA